MDNKLEQQYGTDIGCYRLRSERRRKRARREAVEKELLRLDRLEGVLWNQQRDLPMLPLEPPVQKGWMRRFVLRDDVARSSQAARYEALLAKVNTTLWSHRKDFRVRKRKYGKKLYVEQAQHLQKLNEWELKHKQFSDWERQQLHVEFHYEPHNGRFAAYYVVSDPWRFVLRVRPNIIDKIRMLDAALEAQVDQLDNHLSRNALRGRIARLRGHRVSYRKRLRLEKPRQRNPLKGLPVEKLLDRLKEE